MMRCFIFAFPFVVCVGLAPAQAGPTSSHTVRGSVSEFCQLNLNGTSATYTLSVAVTGNTLPVIPASILVDTRCNRPSTMTLAGNSLRLTTAVPSGQVGVINYKAEVVNWTSPVVSISTADKSTSGSSDIYSNTRSRLTTGYILTGNANPVRINFLSITKGGTGNPVLANGTYNASLTLTITPQ